MGPGQRIQLLKFLVSNLAADLDVMIDVFIFII